MKVEWYLTDGVGAIDVRQNAALAGQLTDFLGRQHEAGRGGDVTEHQDARPRRKSLLKAIEDLIDRGRRPGQRQVVQLDAVACGLLLPAAAATWMFLVG